ncbi:MAG: DUF4157 domain-containing protein [Anaerolinea sp.]|nr:DUF4157 domain-containing protein [Anaerolinea sp.]
MAEHMHDQRRIDSKPPRKTENSANPDVSDPVLKLQGLIGNQAVQRLMKSGTVIQTKLTVTSADNASEREADAVAEQVMQRMQTVQREPMPEEEDMVQGKRDLTIAQREAEPEEEDMLQGKRDLTIAQREAEPEEEDMLQGKRDLNIAQRVEDEEEVQTKSAAAMGGSFDVTSSVEQRIDSQRGGGSAMSADLQRSMEGAFGADFSGVRIHTGSEASELNEAVGARAFTTGSDIFFREGEYKPETGDGQRLLAHELTHTIQQNAVERKGDE